MRIETIQIENFRSIKSATIEFDKLCYFVGPNGAGKSTVLAALNVFFRNAGPTHKNVNYLESSDFTDGDTSKSVSIKVTFNEIDAEAASDLSHYVRQGTLIVSAIAKFDDAIGRAPIKQVGSRLGIIEFARFHEATSASEKKEVYGKLRDQYPDLPSWTNQNAAVKQLENYESTHTDLCIPIDSEDQFYGATKGKGKLDRHVQWVYVPAVKDASQEQSEARNSAIGQLVNLLVSDRSGINEQLAQLKRETDEKYTQLLEQSTEALKLVEEKLSEKLASWASEGVRAHVDWEQEEKSIQIQAPMAAVGLEDSTFRGEVSRFGHGLQRTYLFAVLQALAESKSDGSISIVVGCEEPELYQHPSEVRNLANVFDDLSNQNTQVVATTHSPIMIVGQRLEQTIRVFQTKDGHAQFSIAKFDRIADRFCEVTGRNLQEPRGMMPKVHRSLEPWITELLFGKFIVFVESREDQAYLSSVFASDKKSWRRHCELGICIIPVFGKSKLLMALLIADAFDVPFFVMFDQDGNCKKKHKHIHEAENKQLLGFLGAKKTDLFSKVLLLGSNYAAWPNSITTDIQSEVDKEAWRIASQQATSHLGNAPGLKKDPLAIGFKMNSLMAQNHAPKSLLKVIDAIFARAATDG